MKKITCFKKRKTFVGLVGLTALLVCAPLYAQTGPAPTPQGYIQAISDVAEVNFIQHSIVRYSEGSYVVAGTVTPGVVSGDSDILVLRVGDDGVIAWGKYVAYDQDEFAGSVKVDDSQNIVLTGYTGDNGTSAKNLIVVKLDGNGNLINDVVIRDPNLQYGLYGLDIVQTFDQEAYIIAGTGVQNATEAAPKYAFVLRIDYGLDNIRWAKIYRSNIVTPPTPPGPTNYDSFNHILRIRDHATFGECYLLSGSGATPMGQQMTANELIDPAGVSQWTSPSNYGRPGSNYDFPATTALYNELNYYQLEAGRFGSAFKAAKVTHRRF